MAAIMRCLAAMSVVLTVVEAAQRYGAVAVVPDALIPRYVVDKSFPLARRAGSCDEGHHPCEDTKNPGQCCDNDSYCYVNNEGEPKCCPLGSNCPLDTECDQDSYFCTQTVTESGTAVPREGCCGRACPGTSQYLCLADDGGKCCPYDFDCQGGNCVSTAGPSSTALLTPIEEGCTTSQYRCPDGDGCCDNDQSCTEVTGTAYCAAGRPTETDLEYIDDDSSGELSEGAKAGIGVGAVVGAAAIIGGLTWLCIYKRCDRRRRTASQPSDDRQQHRSNADAADVAETEITQSSRPPRAGHGLTQDYFGPDPVAGPFTEPSEHHYSAAASTSPGPHRAVPSQPEQPGDIAVPVEIDSGPGSDYDRASPLPTPSSQGAPQPHYSDTIDGRFELYGSTDNEPPPRSPSIMPTPVAHRRRIEDEG